MRQFRKAINFFEKGNDSQSREHSNKRKKSFKYPIRITLSKNTPRKNLSTVGIRITNNQITEPIGYQTIESSPLKPCLE